MRARARRGALRLAVAAALVLVSAADAAGQCTPLTLTVDSTADGADAVPGDGLCRTSGVRACTLRAAIMEANASACEPTTIRFAIAGTGLHVILLDTNPLPYIVRQVVIDGYTQPGAAPNTAGLLEAGNAVLAIELRGTGNVFNGLGIICSEGESRPSEIRGLVLNGFTGYGFLNDACDGVRFSGNYVGVSADGRSPGSGSQTVGVLVQNAADNRIGGGKPAERNVISGASAYDLVVTGSRNPQNEAFRTWRNDIVNNFVGTDALGRQGIGGAAPIGGQGISVIGWGANPVVADPIPSTPQHEDGNYVGFNVVGGHAGRGIWLAGSNDDGDTPQPSVGTFVAGNIVGHGVAAAALLTSGGDGPVPTPAASLANGLGGIVIGYAENGSPADRSWVQQNAVTQSAVGIDFDLASIGGAEDNVVWNNKTHGMRLTDWSSLAGNRIWENGGLGIAAEIASADPLPWIVLDDAPGTEISGTVYPPTSFPLGPQCVRTSIEVFANDACDPSGFGEARESVDLIEVDGCSGAFAATHPVPYSRPFVAATANFTFAIDVGGTLYEYPPFSSDLSNCIADPAPEPSVLSQLGAGLGLLCLLARRRGRRDDGI